MPLPGDAIKLFPFVSVIGFTGFESVFSRPEKECGVTGKNICKEIEMYPYVRLRGKSGNAPSACFFAEKEMKKSAMPCVTFF